MPLNLILSLHKEEMECQTEKMTSQPGLHSLHDPIDPQHFGYLQPS